MTMTDSPLVIAVGRALYGEQWQSEMSRAVGVEVRTVQRWAAGEMQPRPGRWADLLELIEARARELPQIAASVRDVIMRSEASRAPTTSQTR